MFRVRRYRIFLILAVFTIFVFYRFGTSSFDPSTVSSIQQQLGIRAGNVLPHNQQEQEAMGPEKHTDYDEQDWEEPIYEDPEIKLAPPPLKEDVPRPVQSIYSSPQDTAPKLADLVEAIPLPLIGESGESRKEGAVTTPTEIPVIHWTKGKEHFPVKELRSLPKGSLKKLPKIQYDFSKREETAAERELRGKRLAAVKAAFTHAWTGYKTFAWGKDELTPVSGKSKDPFMGWGATLVDSLDTMWMMGMKTEFEEAVEEVGRIDFTTSTRNDIPLFETVIRYVGGLIGAYDVSGQKYPLLLNQSMILMEVLLGAFDTPNRMPIPYYQWKPTFSSQPHRASNRLVLAEMGSFAVEFTRLSQITGDQRYYDVIARITDALEEFQNHTTVPGLWPSNVDASGCAHVKNEKVYNPAPALVESPMDPYERIIAQQNAELDFSNNKGPSSKRKRQLVFPSDDGPQVIPTIPEPGMDFAHRVVQSPGLSTNLPECPPHGIQSTRLDGDDEYALGALADSTYEYFPKEYIMLGGRVDQYKTMYEYAADTAKSKLLFRVMHPDESRVLLVGGKRKLTAAYDGTPPVERMVPEGSHLTCFVGGMYGLGAKLFDRPQDLEVAKQLTDACVWAYENTGTGIMPEVFTAMPCAETFGKCAWNETKWHETLDPSRLYRQSVYETQMEQYHKDVASRSELIESRKHAATAVPSSSSMPDTPMAIQTAAPEAPAAFLQGEQVGTANLEKRRPPQYRPDRDTSEPTPSSEEESADSREDGSFAAFSRQTSFFPTSTPASEAAAVPFTEVVNPTPTEEATIATPVEIADPPIWSPPAPLTHKEFVADRIKRERLFPGLTYADDRRYILRPEAIESMWYMWRLTGETYWQEKGWNMVNAVLTNTKTQYGASGIHDVFARSKKIDATKPKKKKVIKSSSSSAPHPYPSATARAAVLSSRDVPTPTDDGDDEEESEGPEVEHAIPNDSMESFWLAETLKYAWLLFEDPDKWSLDEWVLNTEAHLLRRPDAAKFTGTYS